MPLMRELRDAARLTFRELKRLGARKHCDGKNLLTIKLLFNF